MKPLQGVRVVEIGNGISAAYCCMILADLGADVVKIESAGGDVTRRLGPFPGDKPEKELSGAHLYLNRNKRSITIDLESPSGQDIARSLIDLASVVVENLQPGALAGLGLSYEELSSYHPNLVMTSITPFGQTGPYRDFKADEINLFALGGLMTSVGDIKREPVKLGGSPMLYMGGLFGFTATTTALYLAEEAGVGQHADVSIFEGLAGSHAQDVIEYEYTGAIKNRGELRTPIPCADGFISFAVQAHQYPDLQRLILGSTEEVDEEEDVIERDRRRREGDMDLQILIWASERTKLDAYREAQEGHIPAAYLADAQDVYSSPQLRSRNYFVKIDHPRAGEYEYPGSPAKISGSELTYSPAPLLGQHTDELLKELGFDSVEITEMKSAGVV